MKICSACRRCYEDAVLSCIEENHNSLINARSGSSEIIADYRLESLLECDAISETYTATNILLDERCAVTMVDANLVRAAQQLQEQFQNEAQTAAAVDHPNIVRVYDSGILESNEFYVVTEFAEGQTLREYLNGVGATSEKNAVMIARQTAGALEAAHKAGVQHRNLNPANIILTSSPEDEFLVKIQNFDFGNVRQAAAFAISDSAPRLSRLRYSSPEQCASQTTDARTDIYSLGVVLYEMLKGEPPFDAPDAAELIHKQINEPPPPVKIPNFDIRALLTHTLMQALQKNPTRRLQTANAFVRQLRHIEQLIVRSPVPLPAQVFERISVPNATSSNAPIAKNNAFAVKSDNNSFFQEVQPSIRETAETPTASPAETEQFDWLKVAAHEDQEDQVTGNVAPPQPELIFVEQNKTVDSQLTSEFDSAESKVTENVSSEQGIVWAKEFDYDEVGFEPFHFKDESVADAPESESAVSSMGRGIKQTPARPTNAATSHSPKANHRFQHNTMLKRPILAGAWLAALLVSAVIGLLLNEKFQHSDPQPSSDAAPVQESVSLPKSEEPTLTAGRENTAITEESVTEESETKESDVPDLEKYTPVKFEKPVSAASVRDGKSQFPKEKIVNKTETKEDKTSDKKPAPEENVVKTKAKQNAPLNKKPPPKKQIAAPTEVDIFMRPRKVESSARRKN